jgi:hypothetical protein
MLPLEEALTVTVTDMPPLCACLPPQDSKGNAVSWGNMPYEWIFGEKGWCEADRPQHL